jgi:hypothetical protein
MRVDAAGLPRQPGATVVVGIYPSIRARVGAMDAGAPRTPDGGIVEWDEAGWMGIGRTCGVGTFSGKRRVVKSNEQVRSSSTR